MFVRVRNPRLGNQYDLDESLVDEAVAEGRVERLDSDRWPDSPTARPGLPKRTLEPLAGAEPPTETPDTSSGTADQTEPTAGDQHE